MIEVDQYQRIRYLHTVEGVSQREIAKQLGISRNTVAKYCKGARLPEPTPRNRSNSVMTNELLEVIRGYLTEDQEAEKIGAKKQRHTATRIFERLKEEENLAFEGSYESVARIVRQLRQEPSEAFIPLAWDAGNAMQVDWGEATIIVAGERAKAHMFCTRLCYSAVPFVALFPAERSEFFLDGHRQAFEYYQGVTRRVIYDNLRTAVREGWGRYVKQKQPTLKFLEAHYAFTSEFCNPGEGHEKGLVEGLVGWARRNILTPIPKVNSWSELNVFVLERCVKYIDHQIAGRNSTVRRAFEEERQHLLDLPEKPFETCRVQTCRVYGECLIRVDNNYYSVPSQLVGQTVTAKAFPFHIEVWFQGQQVARHVRSFSAGETKYQLSHYLDVLERKPRAVRQAKPVRAEVHARIQAFRDYLGEGAAGDREFVKVLALLVEYGQSPVITAIEHCMNHNFHSYAAVQFALMQSLQAVPEVAAVRELDEMGPGVTDADLGQYDELIEVGVAQ